MLSVENINAELNTKFLARNIIYLPEANSTNAEAWKYVNDKITNGSIIITDYQTSGKGRRKNVWSSFPGKSLTFSIILFSKDYSSIFSLFPLLTGLSIVNGILSSVYIQTGLKWPNDIMLSRKKMGGILIESKLLNNDPVSVIGIGLNINENIVNFPNSIQNHATSLSIYSHKQFNREQILAEILNEFEVMLNKEAEEIINLWEKNCIHNNSCVSFHSKNKKYNGIFQGIGKDGYAKIKINENIKKFSTGFITL
tara:strand:- start:4376 stop:5137 length:762 start_codon:yes stop_codon:yes gene_type:complete